MLKIAVITPMPSASVRTATAAKPGARLYWRAAYRTSHQNLSTVKNDRGGREMCDIQLLQRSLPVGHATIVRFRQHDCLNVGRDVGLRQHFKAADGFGCRCDGVFPRSKPRCSVKRLSAVRARTGVCLTCPREPADTNWRCDEESHGISCIRDKTAEGVRAHN